MAWQKFRRFSTKKAQLQGVTDYVIPKSKFKNINLYIDNIKFDSKLEAQFYSWYIKPLVELKVLIDLACHKRFQLHTLDGSHLCYYEVDFVFYDKSVQKLKAIEVKGFETPEWKLKAKLFKTEHKDYTYEVWYYKDVMKFKPR